MKGAFSLNLRPIRKKNKTFIITISLPKDVSTGVCKCIIVANVFVVFRDTRKASKNVGQKSIAINWLLLAFKRTCVFLSFTFSYKRYNLLLLYIFFLWCCGGFLHSYH